MPTITSQDDIIKASELDEVATWQGLDPSDFTNPGDWVIIRTGFIKQYNALSTHDQEVLPPRDFPMWIGLEASEETLIWAWEKKISMIGADNPGVESYPFGAVILGENRSLHEIFISGWGQNIGRLEPFLKLIHRSI
ncbi:hypothetical protein J3R30DRAFT_3579028 [Lentinula aciculospora]|uniref:Uncharacterized protein n=1 Tax=Lentinula aciculospora TaxID=153920 RepID=A0A9W8ZWB6_9AGAR|nr:hypothetical protein J3R30DRAFT_3579028 [Lentinula aciculospora]